MIAFSRGETRQLLRSVISLRRWPARQWPARRSTAFRHHARRDGAARHLRRQAHQRLSGQLRQRPPVTSGTRDPVRSRYGRAGLRGSRRRDHSHPNRRSERCGHRCPSPQGRAAACHPRLRRAGRHPCPRHRPSSQNRVHHRLGPLARARSGAYQTNPNGARHPGLRGSHRAAGRRSRRHRLYRHRRERSHPQRRMGAARHARQRRRVQALRAPRKSTTIWWSARASSPTAAKACCSQGAEFLRAKAAGFIDDDHVVAEIGQVLAGDVAGRRSPDEITVYKSLGHVVQDFASAWALYPNPASERY